MKKKRDRTLKRELARVEDKLDVARNKLLAGRTKLAALEPGGAPERPLVVDSASQIEGRAASLECFRCDANLKVHEHRALHDPVAVREIDLSCPRCGLHRVVYYRVGASVN